MTLDARALVAIVSREPGFEQLVAQLAEDENPRVVATAMAEAAILLSACGDTMSELTLQVLVDQLRITVVPFTKDHWRGAVREYERSVRAAEAVRPTFGKCLSIAVSAKLGAPLLSK
jgi:ribonuclease VapC